MFLYLTTPIIALLFGGITRNTKILYAGKNFKNELFLLVSFLIPVYVFACRSTIIGIDTQVYCDSFKTIRNIDVIDLVLYGYDDFERGFLVFCKILSTLGDNPIILLIGSSLLINGLYARAILKQSNMLVLSALIYFFLGNYLYNLNIMRQAIAAGILLNAIPLLLEEKNIKYTIAVALAAGFHIFSIVGLLLIIPVHMINNRRQLIIFLITMSVIILTSLEIVHIIVLRFFLHFDYYFRHNYHSEQHFGVTSFAYVIIEAFTIVLMLKNYRVEKDSGRKIIVYSVAITAAAFGLIMMPMFGIYERIAKYFQPFLIIAIPYALDGLKTKRLVSLFRTGIVFFSFIYYCYIIFSDAYKIVPFVTFY